MGRYNNGHISIKKSSVNLNRGKFIHKTHKMYCLSIMMIQRKLIYSAWASLKEMRLMLEIRRQRFIDIKRDLNNLYTVIDKKTENKQQTEHMRNDNLNNLLDTETIGTTHNPDIIKEFEKDFQCEIYL